MVRWIWLVWDIVALSILIMVIFRGAKSGLIRSLVSAVSYIAATVAGLIFGPRLATWTYVNVMRAPIHQMVLDSVDTALEQGASQAVESIPGWLAAMVQPYLTGLGDTTLGEESKALIAQAVDTAVEGPITWFFGALFLLLLFLVIVFLLRGIAKLFTKVNNIPVIGTANMVLGGVFGVFQAGAILYVLAVVLNFIIELSANSLWWLNNKVIGSTYILRTLFALIQ